MDVLNETGKTPLDIAAKHSDYSTGAFKQRCCQVLLELGADPNRIDHEGLTPLNHAGPNNEIIEVLLDHGADVNAGTKGVLMSAVEAGDVDTLQIYLQNGANCNIPDSSKDSSYRSNPVNVPSKYPIVVAALSPPYSELTADTPLRMMKLLLEHGARVDLPVSENKTILHYLFERARSSVLCPLLEHPDIDLTIRGKTNHYSKSLP